MVIALLLLGCNLPACARLCEAKADCLDAEIRRYDTSWPEWTGFASREEYEAACFQVFDEGPDQGATRREVRRVCKAEIEAACQDSSSP